MFIAILLTSICLEHLSSTWFFKKNYYKNCIESKIHTLTPSKIVTTFLFHVHPITQRIGLATPPQKKRSWGECRKGKGGNKLVLPMIVERGNKDNRASLRLIKNLWFFWCKFNLSEVLFSSQCYRPEFDLAKQLLSLSPRPSMTKNPGHRILSTCWEPPDQSDLPRTMSL